MVVARKGPDVAFKLRKEFDDDGIGVLRDKVALGHFKLIALEGAASGHQLIARAGSEDEKIRFEPFPFDAVAGLRAVDVNAHHAGALQRAAGFLGALEKQTVQNFARINHDGMGHFEGGVMLLAADELDGVDELFGIGIVEQEREALDGFVSESSAAGFLPGEMLVKKIYLVAGSRELLATHSAGGPAAYDCNFGHRSFVIPVCVLSLRTMPPGPVMRELETKAFQNATPLGDGEDHQAETSEEYSTECGGCQG